jgi:hypothetical protein
MHGQPTVHQLIEIYHNICLSLENREVICTVMHQKHLIKFGNVAYLKNSKLMEFPGICCVGLKIT